MGWLWDTEEEQSYQVHSIIRPGTCKKELGNYKKIKWELSGSFNHKTSNMQKGIRELQKFKMSKEGRKQDIWSTLQRGAPPMGAC
jgi:hypothetical protein